MALHALLQHSNYNVQQLLTTVNAHHDRVSMHGVRRALLHAQCNAIGLPWRTVELPQQPENNDYEHAMALAVNELKASGYTHSGFGDIFLEDLRAYREAQLSKVGVTGVFPLWKKDTGELARHFTDGGYKAVVVCVDGSKLPESFAGREYDAAFLADLPDGVDPCGEHGEFHTFCYDAPFYREPVSFSKGDVVCRTYHTADAEHKFWFCDLLPL